ncbi:MAG: DUF4339 domain-containing protein [Methylobacteriaceae bacterium]|nr:DUF4339 domain-containing protein [Methylobacteriaceae bacterium]MBV9245488.1 DUF4339 domain-containing protein [Methylobacteriaceae bacterium]MBV9634671.1 DUF4339 domain-containing protein [Methylobacteriaceae bacterium]MBV9704196.1 DUF4339 domain-containing protein [Methylobacteriaceae bacterium]
MTKVKVPVVGAIIALTLPLLLTTSGMAQNLPSDSTPPPLPAPPVEQPPPLPVTQFFIGENGKPVGPLSLEEVQDRIRKNNVTRTTLVWKHGMPNWVEAQTVPELADSFAAVVPPAPQPPTAETFSRYMVGTWESTSLDTSRGLTVRVKVAFSADGSFRGTYAASAPNSGVPNSTPIFGTWTVAPVAEKRFKLTMTVSAQGSPRTETETTNATIIDDTSFRDESDGTVTRKVGP